MNTNEAVSQPCSDRVDHIEYNHDDGCTAQNLPRIGFGHTEEHDQCGNDANDVPGDSPRLGHVEAYVNHDVDQVPYNEQRG